MMRQLSKLKATILVVAVVVTMAAVACICPFGPMATAQMTTMMGHDMDAQPTDGMCPMLCGVPPYSVGVESNGLVLEPLSVNPILKLATTIRPIFHPPTLA